MAKRGGGGGRRRKDAEFEVEDAADAPEAGPASGLETGLVFATFAALVLALVLLWQKSVADHGAGPFSL